MFKYAVHIEEENIPCAGPVELETWLKKGSITEKTWVWCHASRAWRSAREVLDVAFRRSSDEIIEEVDQTFSDLRDVAEQLREMLKNDSPRIGETPGDRRITLPNYAKPCAIGDGA